MKINASGWTIVLAGNWNKNILSPEWSAKHIFDVQTLKVEFAINFSLPPRFSSSGVTMLPSNNTVVFMPLQYDDDCLQRAEQFAHKLLEKLPYTPMDAFGVNFGFIEDNPGAELLSLFNFTDNSSLGELGGDVKETGITRMIQIEDKIVNLTVSNIAEGIVFDFNFHTAARDASEANEKLNGQVLANRDLAYRMLSKIYNLELQE